MGEYRRSDVSADYPDEAVEYAPSTYSEDQDLVSQLRDKIRNQAQRLRLLEQYRVLCEQRISELNPGHPFPVTPEHLGQTPHNELYFAKQKIAKLEQHLTQQSVPLGEN